MEPVSYCRYGAHYRKNTNVWSNAWSSIGAVKVCAYASPCKTKQHFGRHNLTAQAGPSRDGTQGSGGAKYSHAISEALLKKLLHHVSSIVSLNEDINAQRVYALHVGDLIRPHPLESRAFVATANDTGGAATLLHRRFGHAHGAVMCAIMRTRE